MERILMFFAEHSKGCITFGGGLISAASLLAYLGLRLGRAENRVERLAARVDITPPEVLGSLPRWLRLLIPESPVEWTGLLGLALLGVWLVLMARWAKRFW